MLTSPAEIVFLSFSFRYIRYIFVGGKRELIKARNIFRLGKSLRLFENSFLFALSASLPLSDARNVFEIYRLQIAVFR